MAEAVDREAIARVARLLVPDRVLLMRSMVDLADVPGVLNGNVVVQYSRPVCENFLCHGIDDKRFGYEFEVVTGLRFLDEERLDQGGSEPEDCVIGLISAEFTVFYHSETEAPCADSDILEFSKQNVIYHVWPYWREFNQSACFRAGITPPPIGVFMIDKFSPPATE